MGLGKKKKHGAKLPPPPSMPTAPLPPPPGAMPLPPMPAPPMPDAAPLPPAPAAPPMPPMPPAKGKNKGKSDSVLKAPSGLSLKISHNEKKLPPPVEALAPTASVKEEEKEPEKQGYSSLYAKKSGKPLKQVYGHIERIGTGEIGSLLERYSDRFGHELDRDIIVMRKGERDSRLAEIRDSPTVELLNAEEEEDEDEDILDSETLIELNSQLKSVEDELRRLKPEYQTAKSEGDRALLRELRPNLESLMAERKMIKAVISGEADIDDLLAMGEEEEEEIEEEEIEEEGDLFLDFVSIVDSLLGSNLPEDAIDGFTQSDGFEVYRTVGSDPEGADEDMRKEFFTVVDSLLGGMPEEAVSDFVESEDFETYRAIGAMYS